MNIVSAGIDLAKNIFALHGVDQHGTAKFIKPKAARGQWLEMVAHCLLFTIRRRGRVRPQIGKVAVSTVMTAESGDAPLQ